MRHFLAGLLALGLLVGLAGPAFSIQVEDLVCETTTTTGQTTPVELAGAASNFRPFSEAFSNGDTVYYSLQSGDGKLESGSGTWTDAAPDTLSREVRMSSDGAATLLSLTGTSTICATINADALYDGTLEAALASVSVGNAGLTVGSSIPFSDSSGTLTLQNVDAIDATAEATFEGALDLQDLQGAVTDGQVDGSAEVDEVLNSDLGDFTCTAGSCALDDDVVAPAEMANADHGDFTYSGGVATLDADVVAPAEIADADFGDFSCSGGSCTLDADVVAPAEMADADHGDISWSGGVASVDVLPAWKDTYFTTSGSFVVDSLAVDWIVECVAAGGGTGGAEGDAGGITMCTPGAGGGQYVKNQYTAAEMGSGATVTIGAAGAAGGTTPTNGGAATDTTFNPDGTGTTMTMDGGGLGEQCCPTGGVSAWQALIPGNGGNSGTFGDLIIDGEQGGFAVNSEDESAGKDGGNSGRGGASKLGFGGAGYSMWPGRTTDSAGATGQEWGGGAGGACDDDDTGSAGGAGGPAMCVVHELLAW